MLSQIASFDFGNMKYRICLSVCIIIFAFPVFAEIPDTGQTKCYNDKAEILCPKKGQDYYGQDGNYTIKPPSYTLLNGGAMVKDNVTGLIWENKTTDGSIHDTSKEYNWNDAQSVFIKQLNSSRFGGYNDWRLPTIRELYSIVDYSRHEPSIDTRYFPNTQSYFYWASSKKDFSGDTVVLSFSRCLGFGAGDSNEYGGSGNLHVRAVRGGQPMTDNLIIKEGIVNDKSTGLMWQQATGNNGQRMIWKEALSYCRNLTLAGYKDWRLPNIKELASIVESSYDNFVKYVPNPNTTKYDGYFSSTTAVYRPEAAWCVFNGGSSIDKLKQDYYVRCVRGGQ